MNVLTEIEENMWELFLKQTILDTDFSGKIESGCLDKFGLV